MNSLSVAVCFVTYVTLAPVAAVAQPTSQAAAQKAPPSADSLRAIEERGLRLAQYDFVADAATDSLRARRIKLGPEDRYVVRRTSDTTWEAVFGRIAATGDAFLVSHVARQRPASPEKLEIEVLATPRPDTGFVLRAARALSEAVRDFGPQSRPYNAAVLERPDGGLFVFHVLVRQPRVPEYVVSTEFLYGISTEGRIRLYGRSRDILGK